MVERAAFAISVNEAWALLALVALIAVLLVPLAGKLPASGAAKASNSRITGRA
jgi:DHA2 family multidrug resistance protein